MGRLVTGAGAACIALLAACNMLSGVDSLTAEPGGEQQPEIAASSGTSGSAGSSGATPRPPHDNPPTSSSSGQPPADDAGIDAASEAAAALPTFTDDFGRPNGSAVGNGWIEKTAGKFPIVNGAAQQNQSGLYRNLFVSRPASEDARDVLVQTTVTYPNNINADMCLFARIQPGSEVTNRFLGYSAYPDGDADFYISRDDGTMFTDLGSSVISPPLTPGQSYQLSLQVTGTSPVHLVASITKVDGTVLATIAANDASPKRFMAAGSVGFGSSAGQGGRFDDFRRVTLAP